MESLKPTEINTLLPTSYFGNISWYAILLNSDNCLIEAFENFSKQSFRNRSTILSANGRLDLILPVKNKNSKAGIQNMALNHNENWAWNHYHAILSAYGKSPYFEYYQPELEQLFKQSGTHNLWSWNEKCLSLCLKWLKTASSHSYTKEYSAEHTNYFDFRPLFKPSNNASLFSHNPYLQVFVDRFPFQHNLSILDLVFNLGPQSINYLYNQNYKTQLNDQGRTQF